jgi:5'-nucleotidase
MEHRLGQITVFCILILVISFPAPCGFAGTAGDFPARVLITNDNGIDDPKIIALAQAFAARTETWVVAPDRDRSGSGAYVSVTSTGELDLERVDLGQGIRAYAVDGYPGDCVLVALTGLMLDSPPDLVISGINGGANLGIAWIFSGTIGAARVAAIAGFPAMAVSGLDLDRSGALESAVDWVVRLASSPSVRNLNAGEYLTVSLPRSEPNEILGVKVTDRAPMLQRPVLHFDQESGRWQLRGMKAIGRSVPIDSDREANTAGFIAVVPMRVDEVHLERLTEWRRTGVDLPSWNANPPQARVSGSELRSVSP